MFSVGKHDFQPRLLDGSLASPCFFEVQLESVLLRVLHTVRQIKVTALQIFRVSRFVKGSLLRPCEIVRSTQERRRLLHRLKDRAVDPSRPGFYKGRPPWPD